MPQALDDFSDAALQDKSLAQPDIVGPPVAPTAPAPIVPVLAPMTTKVAADIGSTRNAPPSMTGQLSGEAAFKARNQAKDVPLDTEIGAPGFIYFKGALNRAKENEVKYYQDLYGEKNVRQSDRGDIIFRAMDSATGKPKDIVANPHGLEMHDFLDLATQAPEIAGGVIAARYGKTTPGIWNALQKIGQMAIGTETAGALKDVAVRAAEDQPIDPGEIAKSRGGLMVLDAATGAGLAGAGKFLTKAITPFAQRGELQFNLKEAQDYFKSKYGLEIPATAGESTGSSFLLRSEEFMKKTPGSYAPFQDIVNKKNMELAKLQNIMVGLPPEATAAQRAALPTEEQVGQKAISAIGGETFPAEAEVQKARRAALQTGTAEIEQGIAAATGVSVPVERGVLGQALRDTAETKRAAFQAASDADYAAVRNHPLAQDKNLPADDMAKGASDIIKKLPSKEVISEVPTGVTDAQGNQLLRTETGQEVMKEFVPPNVLGKLNEIAGLKGQSLRLDELIQMRTDVANDIAKGEAVPGMQTHWLSKIRDLLTKTIGTELDKLGDPTLKKAWQTANDNYAKGVVPFKKAGISEIFRDPESGGFLGNEALVNRAIKSGDTFKAYKEFYGAASPEFAGLKRAIADNIYETNPISGAVDPNKFLNNLQALYKTSPETARDVFGVSSKPLSEIGVALSSIKGRVNVDDLEKLANSKTLTYQKVLDLASAEAKRDDLYRNKIIKSIADGSFNAEKISPVEFVDRFVNKGTPEEVRHIIALLGGRPDVLDAIRSQTAQKVLAEASPAYSAVNNPAIIKGSPMELKASKIQDALGDKTQREKYKAILGQGIYDDLEQMTKALAPSELKEKSFGAAGGLSAGMQIASLLQRGDIAYLFQAGKNYLGAFLLTSPIVRGWARNNLIGPQDSAAFVRLVVASTPFLEAVRRDFGKNAPAFVQNMKVGLDNGAKAQDPGAGKIPADRF